MFLKIFEQAKPYLKQSRMIREVKQLIWSRIFSSTTHNILNTFPSFVPYSSGSYGTKSSITINTINRTIPRLASFSKTVQRPRFIDKNVTDFTTDKHELSSALKLKKLFDRYGSDKSNTHNYHHLYGSILTNSNSIKLVCEIGLGTNNKNIICSMSRHSTPGASVRAFRDFLPNATIFGADIDKDILFEEDRIRTFFVDQTSPESMNGLSNKLPNEFDLIIDDGLHSPDANIETLKFGLQKIKIGGWVVIEDILYNTRPIWEVVSILLPENYEAYIINTNQDAIMFAVRKLA